jgi:hypothetical protein
MVSRSRRTRSRRFLRCVIKPLAWSSASKPCTRCRAYGGAVQDVGAGPMRCEGQITVVSVAMR